MMTPLVHRARWLVACACALVLTEELNRGGPSRYGWPLSGLTRDSSVSFAAAWRSRSGISSV